MTEENTSIFANFGPQVQAYWIKHAYFLYILLYTGFANSFFRGQAGMITLGLISLLVMWYFRIRLTRRFFAVIGIWLAYCAAVYATHQVFTPFFYIRHVMYILAAFVILNLYRDQLFEYYERYVTAFAAISLVFFAWLLVSPGSLFSVASVLDISGDMERPSVVYHNFILYTVEISEWADMTRNYGFAFEPGPFSVILMLAIGFNIMRTNFRLSGNPSFWILTVAMLTTYSTTGYLALFLLVLYIAFRRTEGLQRYLITGVLFLVILYLFFTLEFMYDKIMEVLEGQDTLEFLLYLSAETGEPYSAGRIAGMLIAFYDFMNYPLLGTGGISMLSIGRSEIVHVYIVSGLGTIISTYGLFGIVVITLLMTRSTVALSQFFGSEHRLAILIILLIGLLTFNVHFYIIIFSLLLYHVFIPREEYAGVPCLVSVRPT